MLNLKIGQHPVRFAFKPSKWHLGQLKANLDSAYRKNTKDDYASIAETYCRWLCARDGVTLGEEASTKVLWDGAFVRAVQFTWGGTPLQRPEVLNSYGHWKPNPKYRETTVVEVVIPNHNWVPSYSEETEALAA